MRRFVRRQARHLRACALPVLVVLATLSLGLAVGGWPRADAAPVSQVPAVVGLAPAEAQDLIKKWSPPDGSVAVAQLLPPGIPDLADPAPVVVVRQGTPVSPTPGLSRRTTQVPLTLGVVMPTLTDGTRSAATQVLESDALMSVTWTPTDAADDDIVTGQSPTPGTLVAFTDPVVVSFTRYVPVPNVGGLSLKEASRRIAAAGLAPASTATSGHVTDQFPPPLTLVLPGSTVTLTLDPGVTVPNVVGLTVDQARQAVEQAGLVLNPPSAAGRVTDQRPVAGRSVRRGRGVSVTVVPLPGLVVPDVVGKTVPEARKTLADAGLRLVEPSVAGRVVGQRPRAGSLAFPGSSVAVTIAVPPASHRWQLAAAVLAGLLALGATAVTVRRWRRRRWIAQHVRVTMSRDAGLARRRDGGIGSRSWRITVARRPGPAADPLAKEVTHADR
jgi:eukaryotic-like serine/threonine-protein kinase